MYLCFLGHALAEPSSPLNYASVKGENLRLNCSTENDDSRFWFRSNPLSTEEELIYHNSYLHDRLFSVDESVPGRLDLLFILREGISGRFGCDSGYETRTAEIILSGQFYAFIYVAVLFRKVIEIFRDLLSFLLFV